MGLYISGSFDSNRLYEWKSLSSFGVQLMIKSESENSILLRVDACGGSSITKYPDPWELYP